MWNKGNGNESFFTVVNFEFVRTGRNTCNCWWSELINIDLQQRNHKLFIRPFYMLQQIKKKVEHETMGNCQLTIKADGLD